MQLYFLWFYKPDGLIRNSGTQTYTDKTNINNVDNRLGIMKFTYAYVLGTMV